MKIFGFLSKPAWESRDAGERRRALAESQDPALIARLAEFARNDADAEVRAAATRRVTDLSLLADRWHHDGDGRVRAVARERLLKLLCEDHASPTLAERERVVRVEEDADLLAELAVQATAPALRRLALEKVTRQPLLIERCQRDADPEIRAWLLTRIDGAAALERIAEAVRKSDKQLARTARDRAAELKREAGDPAALQARALELCEAFDALARERPADTRARFAVLLTEWATLAPRVDEPMQRRVGGYVDTLRVILDPPPPAAIVVAPETVAAVDIEHAPPAPQAEAPAPEPERVPEYTGPDAQLAELATQAAAPEIAAKSLEHLRQRFERRLRDLGPQAAQDPAVAAFERAREDAGQRHAREAEQVRQRHQQFLDALRELDAACEAGQLATARAHHAALEAAAQAPAPWLDGGLKARRARVEEAYAKLARWQQWSNNKQRARLCDEIEALPAAALHPDAVATKVRDAQTEWARIDALEGIAPGKNESGLARRFRALCHRALAPARGYFEKRQALRAGKREDVEAFLARVEAEVQGEVDSRRLPQLRGEVGERLRLLDELDPKVRGAFGKRLRDVLARCDTLRDAARGAAEAEKRKLIANLKRKLAQAELAEALDLARDAQARWRGLPRLGRELDDALYQELRELVDPLFKRSDDQRAAQQAQADEAAQQAQAVLDELAELANDDGDHLRQGDARLAAITTRWRALTSEPTEDAGDSRDAGRGPRGGRDGDRGRDDRRGRPPRRREHPREREFDQAVDAVKRAMQRAQAARRAAQRQATLDAIVWCAEQERAATPDAEQRERLNAFKLEAPLRDALAARLDRIGQQTPDAARAEKTRRDAELLAVRIECAAGIDSPDSARGLRREYQVQRLASRLGGGVDHDSPEQVLRDFAAIAGLDADTLSSVRARIEQALIALAGKLD